MKTFHFKSSLHLPLRLKYFDVEFCLVMLSPIVVFQENETTLAGRSKSDAREIQNFYQHYYKKYIQALQNAADKADRLVI